MSLTDRAATDIRSELQASPKPMLVALAVATLVLGWGVEVFSGPGEFPARMVSISLLTCALAALGWFIDSWKPALGRWFALLSYAVTINVGALSLRITEAMLLIAVPLILAVHSIGVFGAIVLAMAQTLLVALLLHSPATPLSVPSAIVICLVTWTVTIAMYSFARHVRQLVGWVEIEFERAQQVLHETRRNRETFERTVQELAQANRQLALTNERMAALRAIAEEARRAKTAFVASVSHELRTPLNIVVGLVELMVEHPEVYSVVLSPKMQRDLSMIYRNCERLCSMIDDVLDLTRVEAGHLTLSRERVHLKEIIENCAALVEPLVRVGRSTLRLSVPDHLPTVYCDRIRVGQVMLNLLTNAARYAANSAIEVEAVQRDQEVIVSVSDTGPGIAPEDLERIFEPFWQGTQQPQQIRNPSSGLGLAISKKFVELHGGRMWVESTLGTGTSFFFSLPTCQPVEFTTKPGHMIREDWVWRDEAFRAGRVVSADQLKKPRIIMVDETGAFRSVAKHYSHSVEIIVVQEASQIAPELQMCPASAVILNVNSASCLQSTFDTARKQVSVTPIVGCAVPGEQQCAVDAGALGYLIKPVTCARLKEAVLSVGRPVRRVLVVDDDPDVLHLLTQMLRVLDSTLEVVVASSGQEALSRLRVAPPDLMLLDVVMPDIDGWQVLASMARDGKGTVIPTYLISARDPTDLAPLSPLLLVATENGISPSQVLQCSLAISKALLTAESGYGLESV